MLTYLSNLGSTHKAQGGVVTKIYYNYFLHLDINRRLQNNTPANFIFRRNLSFRFSGSSCNVCRAGMRFLSNDCIRFLETSPLKALVSEVLTWSTKAMSSISSVYHQRALSYTIQGCVPAAPPCTTSEVVSPTI